VLILIFPFSAGSILAREVNLFFSLCTIVFLVNVKLLWPFAFAHCLFL
jgi:hypothetical protein